MLHAHIHPNPDAFAADHTPLWLDHEAECGALLRTVARTPPHKLVCVTVREGDAVRLTACVCIGDQLLFSRGAPDALRCLAEALIARGLDLPGLFAPHPSSVDFARIYAEQTGHAFERVKQLAHFCRDVARAPRPQEGRLRLADPADRARLIRWRDAAQREENTQRPSDAAAAVDADLDTAALFVWDHPDHGPVSTAALDLTRSPRSAHIRHAYTPPERRRSGFAAALVHALGERAAAGGRVVRLGADVVNAPAIRVYTRLGFVEACRMDNMRRVVS